MNFRFVPLIFSAAFMASCATKAPVRPVSAPLTAPAKVEKPTLALAQAQAAEVAKANAVASERVGNISRELSSMRIQARDATSAADRLRKQKAATEAELQEMWQKLSAFEGSADRAEQETRAAQAALDDQKTIGVALQKELSETRAAVDAKNAEAEALRLTLADTEKLRAIATTQAAENAVLVDRANEAKNKQEGEVRLYRWIAGIVAALVLLYVIIKAAKPKIL